MDGSIASTSTTVHALSIEPNVRIHPADHVAERSGIKEHGKIESL